MGLHFGSPAVAKGYLEAALSETDCRSSSVKLLEPDPLCVERVTNDALAEGG